MGRPRRFRSGIAFALVVCAWVAGCAGPATPRASGVQIVGPRGMPVEAAQALALLQRADFVLLGEVHDNPVHHDVRAVLLQALADRQPTVVFEQFARSADAALAEPRGGIEAWLDRAGFDREAWDWPLHKPLLDAALLHGLPMRGGNLEREQVQRVAREGVGALPGDLRDWLDQPLPPAARQAIDDSLMQGHCGQPSATALPRMRDVQVARDVAMADALLRVRAGGADLAILIAGNGHVRRDHGVPLWLSRRLPAARVVAVGFLEQAADGRPPSDALLQAFDVVWVTPLRVRVDPCDGFSLGRPAASEARPRPLPSAP